jgi:hypothetical protein
MPPPKPDQRTFRSDIAPEDLRLLILFDILEPSDRNAFGLRDFLLAKSIRRLLTNGLTIVDVLRDLAGERRSLDCLPPNLFGDGAGRVAVRLGGAVSEIDGQLRLPLPVGEDPSVEALFERAQSAEDLGSWPEAERLYRRCVERDRKDPIAPFHLGNVLCRLGREGEGRLWLRHAAGLDPAFRRGVVQSRSDRRVGRRQPHGLPALRRGHRRRSHLRRRDVQPRRTALRRGRACRGGSLVAALPRVRPPERLGEKGALRSRSLPAIDFLVGTRLRRTLGGRGERCSAPEPMNPDATCSRAALPRFGPTRHPIYQKDGDTPLAPGAASVCARGESRGGQDGHTRLRPAGPPRHRTRDRRRRATRAMLTCNRVPADLRAGSCFGNWRS